MRRPALAAMIVTDPTAARRNGPIRNRVAATRRTDRLPEDRCDRH
jgi:hypothetical protein